MERRQNGGQHRKIVQDYLTVISDDGEWLVCNLYVNNFDDFEVRRFLRISRKQLKENQGRDPEKPDHGGNNPVRIIAVSRPKSLSASIPGCYPEGSVSRSA